MNIQSMTSGLLCTFPFVYPHSILLDHFIRPFVGISSSAPPSLPALSLITAFFRCARSRSLSLSPSHRFRFCRSHLCVTLSLCCSAPLALLFCVILGSTTHTVSCSLFESHTSLSLIHSSPREDTQKVTIQNTHMNKCACIHTARGKVITFIFIPLKWVFPIVSVLLFMGRYVCARTFVRACVPACVRDRS